MQDREHDEWTEQERLEAITRLEREGYEIKPMVAEHDRPDDDDKKRRDD